MSTANQQARPTNDSSNISNNSTLNQILYNYSTRKYQQAFKNSVRASAINEFIIYANGNGDSLKRRLVETNLFDTVINMGSGGLASCPSPTIVNDPLILTWDNWAMNMIDANCAWSITKGDPRVVIGFSDSEFDDGHEDLIGKFTKVWHSIPGYSGTIESHGTKVASVAIANTNNNIGITSIGYNTKGTGYAIDDVSSPREGILEAYKDGHRIINMSWHPDGITKTEAEEMTQHGAILVYAAGNYIGWNCHSDIANVPGVINVSGVNFENKHAPTTCDHNPWVDLCAPCGGVLRAHRRVDGYPHYSYSFYKSTSTSAPIVSGVIALMLSANPCLSPSEVEYILKQTCDPIVDNSSFIGGLGAGRVNAYKAVKFAQETSCMNIGIEINTLCRPGKVAGVPNPQFTVKMEGGTPPYTYKWEPIDYAPGAGIWNTTTLDNYNIVNPTVISSTTITTTGYHIAYYRLIVTDASTVPKMAIRTIKVILSNELKPIVAMRDSYMDMLREPNDQVDINPYDVNTWTSQDVWNRQVADGIEKHENPEYFISAPNYAYTRIRNYGCVASTTNQKLKLYWSKASTGEKWEADWKSTNVKDKHGAFTMPGGREITPSAGITIPALAPAATTIINHSWAVPKPQDFEGEPNSFDVCLLARIEKTTTYPYGMTYPEILGKGVGQNVRNNNTIVTRNLVLTNLNPLTKKTSTREVIVGNGDNALQTFNLKFEADRPIYPLFGGDYSTRGSVTIHLGSLYNRWIAAGGKGEFTSRDETAKTVTMKGNSLLQLNNIEFAANERFTIQVIFNLDTTVTITDSSFQRMHLRQYLSNKPDSLYGAVDYEIKIQPMNQNNFRISEIDSINIGSVVQNFKVVPNPTSSIVYIIYNGEKDNSTELLITDMSGKKVLLDKITFSSGSSKEINLASFATGTYLINITNSNGVNEVHKVVKE